ncbi:hypothetical protein V5O48_007938 [Marasmius crinis-equi]|uniref:Uncharacterized protein n=1 Tax=Marasmius crinis-equi TaxID=585013 RepID=A0ABR3FFP9_9AGAR
MKGGIGRSGVYLSFSLLLWILSRVAIGVVVYLRTLEGGFVKPFDAFNRSLSLWFMNTAKSQLGTNVEMRRCSACVGCSNQLYVEGLDAARLWFEADIDTIL